MQSWLFYKSCEKHGRYVDMAPRKCRFPYTHLPSHHLIVTDPVMVTEFIILQGMAPRDSVMYHPPGTQGGDLSKYQII